MSKQKRHCTAEATAHSLLANRFFYGNKCFFIHTQRYVQAKTSQAETYLALKESQWWLCVSVAFIACDIQQVPGSNASDMQRKRSAKAWTKHRTTLTAKQSSNRRLTQNKSGSKERKHLARTELSAKIKRLACTLRGLQHLGPAWQQRKTIKNRQLVKPWQTHCAKPAVHKAMPVLQPRARRPRKMRLIPGRKRTKHANIASRT